MDLISFIAISAVEAGDLEKEKSQLYLNLINKCVKRVPALRPSSEDARCFLLLVYIMFPIHDTMHAWGEI